MSAYLIEVEQALDEAIIQGRRQPTFEDLRQVVRAVAQVREKLNRMVDVDDDRLGLIESRLLIVDDLPTNAPFGAIIRRRGEATVYLGNGPNQPLSKLTPVAL